MEIQIHEVPYKQSDALANFFATSYVKPSFWHCKFVHSICHHCFYICDTISSLYKFYFIANQIVIKYCKEIWHWMNNCIGAKPFEVALVAKKFEKALICLNTQWIWNFRIRQKKHKREKLIFALLYGYHNLKVKWSRFTHCTFSHISNWGTPLIKIYVYMRLSTFLFFMKFIFLQTLRCVEIYDVLGGDPNTETMRGSLFLQSWGFLPPTDIVPGEILCGYARLPINLVANSAFIACWLQAPKKLLILVWIAFY